MAHMGMMGAIPNHICMLDGADYAIPCHKSRYEELLKENDQLKALLSAHNISWLPKTKGPIRIHGMRTRTSSISVNNDRLPHLPMEIQLRILRYAMKCPFPIIDPFSKPQREHLTKSELAQRKRYPMHILSTCRAYYQEGLKLFFLNSFIFTQIVALENFATVSNDFRATIKHVTLRVVGKYYADHAERRDIFHGSYHPAIRNFKSPIHGRPQGTSMDHGIHAYCWQQFADFMMHLQIPSNTTPNSLLRLFPNLSKMRVDLVNFCEHLHYPGPNFASILRWQTGSFLDELIISGIPDDDPDDGPEQVFSRIVKDEGVFAAAPPVFVSLPKNLKALPPLELVTRVVRADLAARSMRLLQTGGDRHLLKRAKTVLDPADGKPPKSFYSHGRTIWRFTIDSLTDCERKWIEFDRTTGYPVDDLSIWSDMDDSVMYDSEGNYLDDDYFFSSDAEMDDAPPFHIPDVVQA